MHLTRSVVTGLMGGTIAFLVALLTARAAAENDEAAGADPGLAQSPASTHTADDEPSTRVHPAHPQG